MLLVLLVLVLLMLLVLLWWGSGKASGWIHERKEGKRRRGDREGVSMSSTGKARIWTRIRLWRSAPGLICI